LQSSLSANEGPEEGGPVGANSSLWGGQASRPAIRHAQFRGAAPYPVVDASFISFTPPPTAGFTRYTASPLQTKPAAQPLAALLPYGCGVPLAGVSPEQIKSFGPPGAWDMPRGTEQAEQVMPVTLNFCFIGFTRLSNVREGSRAAPTSKYGPGWPRTHRSSVRARHRWRPPAHSASGARPKFPCWRG